MPCTAGPNNPSPPSQDSFADEESYQSEQKLEVMMMVGSKLENFGKPGIRRTRASRSQTAFANHSFSTNMGNDSSGSPTNSTH